MPEKIVLMRIEGRVQGVGYRQWMVDAARAEGLRGWVRNRAGGWVEAVVAGPAEAVDALVAASNRGPAAASVDRVEAQEPDQTSAAALDVCATFVARGTR